MPLRALFDTARWSHHTALEDGQGCVRDGLFCKERYPFRPQVVKGYHRARFSRQKQSGMLPRLTTLKFSRPPLSSPVPYSPLRAMLPISRKRSLLSRGSRAPSGAALKKLRLKSVDKNQRHLSEELTQFGFVYQLWKPGSTLRYVGSTLRTLKIR
eukprot:CAMPEP_0119527680 /NCGR_PEP_ID=MMETSP1344-20130328/42033_1 /TAXON_ID=236787 /ORGANISM="Florenciella parvula, Strain CCMP2471" /LENGTH=154 /DNA_ID=CAMNT_0007566909 /DNA_START=103 /DNA_END=564 /DNA_ORIENTATION=-